MPKVSVIIPVYNAEKYLEECLESVICQTLNDIEIICIDDGSTDFSLKILEEYAIQDNRIKILSQKNRGAGEARNVGIKSALGEFVAFMDADDKYPEEKTLELLYTKAKENEVLICGGEFAIFSKEQEAPFQDKTDWNSKGASLDGYFFREERIVNYKDYQFDYGYHRFIYDSEFLLKNDLFYPHYRRYQDPPFFVKAMFVAKDFFALREITYAYRVEHNDVEWNSLKTNDMLMGILDNMKFAFDNKMEKLNEYSFIRLKQHSPLIKDTINFRSFFILHEMEKYNDEVKKIRKDFKLTFNQRYISPFLRKIFSIKNSDDKLYKIIKILGVKLKMKRKGA